MYYRAFDIRIIDCFQRLIEQNINKLKNVPEMRSIISTKIQYWDHTLRSAISSLFEIFSQVKLLQRNKLWHALLFKF